MSSAYRAAMFMSGLRPGSMSWTIYQGFADGLRGEGIDFELLTDAPPGEAPEFPGTTFLPIAPPGGMIDRLAAPVTRGQRFVALAMGLRRYLASRSDLDLLYMEMAYPLAAAAAVGGALAGWRGALVTTPMGEDVLVVPEAAYGFRRHWGPRTLLSWTLRRSAAIRLISPVVTDLIEPWLDRPHEVIPLNVADETVAAARAPAEERRAAKEQARRRLADSYPIGEAPLVLSLGRLHPFKGIHLLVDAMEQIPGAALVVVGPSLEVRGFGDYAEFLERRAAAAGLQDRVHLVGGRPHSEVIDLLAAADALVVPSIRESLNRVCIEAAAAGTPFVVTSSTGISRFVDEPGVGLVIDPESPAAIAGAVRSVIDGEWQHDDAAACRFVERFAGSAIAPRVARLFDAALGRTD